VAAWVLAAGPALAWEDVGHRMIGELGTAALPPTLPAFLRTPQAVRDIGELAREPDRSRNAGRPHDTDLDPGHFLDADDDGTVRGGPAVAHLPASRLDYETQLRAVGSDSWKGGYLPYNIIEGWQQLAKDFALWRADSYGEKVTKDPAQKVWLTQDRQRRERRIIDDLGYWSHFVGDATQPMHESVHYNGWGDFPNPNGYTQAHIHAPIEGAFVVANIKKARVQAAMAPYADCGACKIEEMTGAFVVREGQYVIPLYQLEKDGGFKDGDPRGVAFITARLAEGAAELRDLVIAAWNASPKATVGYPGIPAADVEAGKAGDAYALLYGGN
jgi:hypothetical protein